MLNKKPFSIFFDNPLLISLSVKIFFCTTAFFLINVTIPKLTKTIAAIIPQKSECLKENLSEVIENVANRINVRSLIRNPKRKNKPFLKLLVNDICIKAQKPGPNENASINPSINPLTTIFIDFFLRNKSI